MIQMILKDLKQQNKYLQLISKSFPISGLENQFSYHCNNRHNYSSGIMTTITGSGKTHEGGSCIQTIRNMINRGEIKCELFIENLFSKSNRIIELNIDFNNGGDKIIESNNSIDTILGSRLACNGLMNMKFEEAMTKKFFQNESLRNILQSKNYY